MRNMTLFRLLYAVFLGCLLIVNLEAQQVVLPMKQLTVADNLTSQTYNYYVFKDSEGFVWISSIDGLNRYDGQGIVQYQPDKNDPYSISNPDIQGEFCEDKYSNVWFGAGDAIHCYDRLNDRFNKYQIKKDGLLLSSYRVLSIDQKKEEIVVVALANGRRSQVYYFHVDEPDSFTFALDCFMPIGVEVVEESDPGLKTVYVPLPEYLGLAKVVLKKENDDINVAIDTVLLGKEVEALFYENDQNIWCIGPEGFMKTNINGDILKQTSTFGEITLKTMASINPFGVNQLLIGTRTEGLFLLDKETGQITGQIYYAKDGKVRLFNSMVDLVRVDRDGTIWISTNGQGVFYLTPGHQKMSAYLQNFSGGFLGRSNIQGIAEDQDGLLWCLTNSGIIVIDSLGNLKPEYKYLTENLPPFLEDYVYSIFSDHNNQIFVCSALGLFALSKKDKSFTQVGFSDGTLPEGIILGLPCHDEKIIVSGVLAISSNSKANLCELIHTKNGPLLKPVSCKDSINGITKMFEDSNGATYLCRSNQNILIGNFSGNRFLVDTIIDEKLVVHGLAEDTLNHCIWIAAKTGLFQLKKTSKSYALIENKTFDQTSLNGILFDDATGYLWISNNNGLHAFHPDATMYRTFTLAEGLQSREFNFWSALKTRSGLFAFGGTNGVNIFNPQKALKLSAKIPVPKITNIQIDDTPDTALVCANTDARNVSEFENIVLKFSKNTVSFNFAALDYCDPTANKFQYRMDGMDEDWVFSGNTNSARYPNLPIGNYKFNVRASSAEGVWSEQSEYITKLKIKILAPWYRTWLAYFIYTVVLLGSTYAFYRSRINRIRTAAEFKRKEAEYKQKEAEFKQKEAEYKQLAAETETAVLRLQMNPHFIFNSMNSISSYILERDVDTANAYLDRFAKLMRMILKLGKQPLIPVADEIDLLEQYMKTEAMRFEQKFDYQVELDPAVDEDDTFVPTMLLQPFVENAIWHGLSGKTGKGHIQIRFWKDATNLFCSIEDNGIGIEASKKKKKRTAHKSKALEITRRRLRLLGEKEGKKADFNFIEVLDEAGQVAGTRVLLQMPIL